MPEASSPTDPIAMAPRPMTEQEAARYAWQRARWVGDPEMLNEIKEDMCRQLSRPAPPPCPSWCTETTMHDGFEELTDGSERQMRSHVLAVSPSVSIVVEEFRNADDSVQRQAPVVYAEFPHYGQLTAADALEAGLALIRAHAQIAEWAVASAASGVAA